MSDYLTAPELAKKFQIHPETVFRLAREGKIPSVKFGRATRFDIAAVERAIKLPRVQNNPVMDGFRKNTPPMEQFTTALTKQLNRASGARTNTK